MHRLEQLPLFVPKPVEDSPPARSVYTIGHSTRPLVEFVAVLSHYTIERLIDIRHFPASRHNPRFNRTALAETLPEHGIEYLWLEQLGGYREGGYQAYMRTVDFESGIEELENLAFQKRTAYMCAEVKWWRCHRRHVSDVLADRDWSVIHIIDQTRAELHHEKTNVIKCD